MSRIEYATLEWLWEAKVMRVDLPGGKRVNGQGEYPELVAMLNDLGQDGWEVATCAAGGGYLFWTLKRQGR